MTSHAGPRILDRARPLRAPASRYHVALVALAVAGASLALGASPARAQRSAGEEMARQQLVERAQAAHASGAHADALGLAQRAAQIRKTPTLLLFIAEEQEELAQYAEAYAYAQQCAREAELDPEAKLRDKAIERCRSVAERLKGKISYVVVNAPNPPTGLSIRLSGQQLNQAAIGVPYVITPGKVSVDATAPGHVPYRLEIDVPEAKTVNVTVSLAPEATPATCPPNQRPDGAGRCVNDSCRPGMLPAADGAACCWPGQTWDEGARSCAGAPRCPPGTEASGSNCVAGRSEVSSPAVGEAESVPRGRGSLRPSAIAVAGVGAAALAASGIIWLVSNGRFNDLKTACNDADGCTPAYREEKVNNIIGLDEWAAGLAIGGAVAVGAAAVLQWALPREPETTRQARLVVDPLNRALLVGGRF